MYVFAHFPDSFFYGFETIDEMLVMWFIWVMARKRLLETCKFLGNWTGDRKRDVFFDLRQFFPDFFILRLKGSFNHRAYELLESIAEIEGIFVNRLDGLDFWQILRFFVMGMPSGDIFLLSGFQSFFNVLNSFFELSHKALDWVIFHRRNRKYMILNRPHLRMIVTWNKLHSRSWLRVFGMVRA